MPAKKQGFARILLVMATFFAAACEHAAVRDARAAQRRVALDGVDLSMPFGLSCDRCMHTHTEACVRSKTAPLAAVVSAPQIIRVERDCAGAAAANSESIIPCSATRLYRFDEIMPLRDDVTVTSADTFEAWISYPQVDREDFERTPAVGPALETGRRYVIFASRDYREAGFAADWYLNIACPIEGDSASRVIP